MRIGILNLLNERAISDIVMRFADAIEALGGQVNRDEVRNALNGYYSQAMAAE